MASFPPDEVAYQESHLYEDQTHNLGAFFIVCTVLSFLCMIARVATRKLKHIDLQADDYTFLIGTALAECSFIVLMIYAFRAGLGKHWLALTPDQQILFPKLNYAYNILNVSCYPIIKISILLLYRRIFLISRRFQIIIWICITFVALMCISNTLVAMFACHPVQGFYDGTVSSKCIDFVQFYWAQAVLNVITDFIILVLPMPIVWKLHTTLKKKIVISLLFVAGGLTFIVSIIRIVYYLRFNAFDPSYSFIGDGFSTAAEVCLATICAGAPTWRPLSLWAIDIVRVQFSTYGSHGSSSYMERKNGSGDSKPSNAHTSTGRQSSERTLTNGGGEEDIEMPPVPKIDGMYGIRDSREAASETKVASIPHENGDIENDGGIKVDSEIRVDDSERR